jgi:hypothetical protein
MRAALTPPPATGLNFRRSAIRGPQVDNELVQFSHCVIALENRDHVTAEAPDRQLALLAKWQPTFLGQASPIL